MIIYYLFYYIILNKMNNTTEDKKNWKDLYEERLFESMEIVIDSTV